MLAWIPLILLTAHALAAGFMSHAWRGRSPHGAPRCRACWYDLTGLRRGLGSKFTCPECGRRARWRPVLFKRQRRLASLLVFSILQWPIGCAWYWDDPGRHGPAGLIPSSVLVWLVDDLEAPNALAISLLDRWENGSLWDWQQRAMTDRALDRWLRERGARSLVRYRPRAVVGEPIEIGLRAAWNGPLAAMWFCPLTQRESNLLDSAGLARDQGRPPFEALIGPRFVTLDPLQPGETRRQITLYILAGAEGPHGPVTRRRVAIDLDLIPLASRDEVLSPLSDDATLAALRSMISLHTRVALPRGSSTSRDHQLVLLARPDNRRGPIPPTCSLAFTWTIEHEGVILESGHLGERAWRRGGSVLATLSDPRWAPFYGMTDQTLTGNSLILRIRPDLEAALANFGADSIWAGQIEIPLNASTCPPRWRPPT